MTQSGGFPFVTRKKSIAHIVIFNFTVDAGCRGVIFDRLAGVKETVSGEGTHFLIPFIQKPIIFDCKARPRNVAVVTGSKGMFLNYDN